MTSAAYFDMISRKTGALTGCSAQTGALAAGAGPKMCDQFGDAGSKLGMAWQLGRDIADLWGQQGDGMTAGNILNKKKSLPLIYAMENSNLAAKRELGAIYAKRVLQPEDVANLVAVLDRCDARRFSEDKAEELLEQAMQGLRGLELAEETIANLRGLGRMALEGKV